MWPAGTIHGGPVNFVAPHTSVMSYAMSMLFCAIYRAMLKWFAFFGMAAMLLAADEPVAAVLASIEGKVTVSSPDGRAPRGAQVFDWLKAGTSIETGAGARALVVLANGKRYQLEEHSRATVRDGILRGPAGKIRPLPGLTEMPRLAATSDAGSSAAAVRIRGPKLRNCYPSPNAAILSTQAILSFAPVTEIKSYLAEVQDDAGNVIHHAELSAPAVMLPSGLLKPGRRYYWEVQGVVAAGEAPRCEAEFTILAVEDEIRRAAFKAGVDKSGDGDSLALLAEIDRRLGLFREAREEFASALNRSSEPEAIRSALRQIDARMQ
jgi:hypothetical protein